jgi:hypothetical protein
VLSLAAKPTDEESWVCPVLIQSIVLNCSVPDSNDSSNRDLQSLSDFVGGRGIDEECQILKMQHTPSLDRPLLRWINRVERIVEFC